MALAMLPDPSGPPASSDVVLFAPPMVCVEADRTVVALRGETDVVTQAEVWDVLFRVIVSQPGDVVIDLAQATFVDVAAVRMLATGHQMLDGTGRKLTFRSPSKRAVQILRLFGLADQIESPPGQRL